MVRFQQTHDLCSTQLQPNTLKIIVSTLFSTGLLFVLALLRHSFFFLLALAGARLSPGESKRNKMHTNRTLSRSLELAAMGCSPCMRLWSAYTSTAEYVKFAMESQNAVKYRGDNDGNGALILVYSIRRTLLRRICVSCLLSAEAEADTPTFSHC